MKKILLTFMAMLFCSSSMAQVDLMAKATPTPVLSVKATPTPTPSYIPTPIDWNAETTEKGFRFFGGDSNYKDSQGRFHKIDNSFQDIKYDTEGKKVYSLSKRSYPIELIAGATPELILRSSRDYQYPDRKLRIKFESAKWGGVKTRLSTAADFTKNPSKDIYVAGDTAVQNGHKYSRLFVRRPAGETNFSINYLIYADDLICDVRQGELSEYTFTTPGGDLRAKIYLPQVADADFNILDDAGEFSHSLEDLGKGVFRYTKSGVIEKSEVEWIDTYTYYADSNDMVIFEYQNIDWTTLRDSTHAYGSYDSLEYLVVMSEYDAPYYRHYRSFMMFDTSGLPDTYIVTSAELNFWAYKTHENTQIYILEGTQSDSPTLYDIDNFTGNYFDTVSITNTTPYAAKSFDFNAAGMAIINKTGNTKFCLLEYHDYQNIAPTIESYKVWIASTDNSTSAYRPYLEIEASAPTPTPTPTMTPTPRPQNSYRRRAIYNQLLRSN